MADLTGIGAVADFATTVVNKIWPDKSEQEKTELIGMFQLMQGQVDVNKVEASNPRLFVSGWRPFIGWICGFGLGYQFLIYPILFAWYPKIQQLDMGTLLTLLAGLLGLAGYRTYEKRIGVEAR